MKFSHLEIKRTASYEASPNTLQGIVKLESDSGVTAVVLSPTALSSIMRVISEEVCQTAKQNAKAVEVGMRAAADEPLLLEQAASL